MIRFSLVEDLYKADEHGSLNLVEMERARRFNIWMADTLRPYVGDRVLEIGAGTGYNAALLAFLVGNPTLVTTIELEESLAQAAEKALRIAPLSHCSRRLSSSFF